MEEVDRRITWTTYPPTVMETVENCCGQWGPSTTQSANETMWKSKDWSDVRATSRRLRPTRPVFDPTSLSLASRGLHRAGIYHWEHLDQQYNCVSMGSPTWLGDHYSLRTTKDVYRAMDHPPAFPALVIDEALAAQALLKRIDDVGLNLSSFIAEIDESAEMIYGFAQRAKRLVRKVQASPFANRTRILKKGLSWRNANDAFLLSSLGIIPTLNDVHSIVEFVNTGQHLAKPIITRFSHKLKAHDSVNSGPYLDSGLTKTLNTRAIMTQKWVVYVKWLPLTSPISIGNPVEWIYERIPFSFMLDWFTTLGDSIALLDALQGVETWAGTVSTRKFQAYDHTQDGYWGERPTSWGCRPNGGTASIKGINTDTWTCISPEHYEEESHQRATLGPEFFSLQNLVPRWEPSASWKKLSIASAIFAGLKKTPQARMTMTAAERFVSSAARWTAFN